MHVTFVIELQLRSRGGRDAGPHKHPRRTGMLPTQAVTPAHWASKSVQNFLLSSEFYQLDSRIGGKVGSGTEHGE